MREIHPAPAGQKRWRNYTQFDGWNYDWHAWCKINFTE